MKLQLDLILAKAALTLEWVRKHLLWLALILVGSFTAASVFRRRSNNISTMGEALDLQKAKKKIVVISEERKKLDVHDREAANKSLRLGAEITAQKKRIAEITTGQRWEELSDAEIEQALREAGL